MSHQFRIGQIVCFIERAGSSSSPTFKIVKLMPVDKDERLRYQIKSPAEVFSRIVEQHELTLE